MKNILFLLIFIFIGHFAYSQQSISDELRTASQITNPTDRLNAYDRILEAHGIKTSAVSPTANNGRWSSSVRIDPVTDNKVITFSLRSSSGVSRFGDPISLVIRWDNGRLQMYIDWNSYLGSSIDVTFRVGDNPPETRRWSLSTDSRASFYPVTPLSIIQSFLDVNQVIARCTPYSESTITAIFDISGLRNIASQYNDDLKWF